MTQTTAAIQSQLSAADATGRCQKRNHWVTISTGQASDCHLHFTVLSVLSKCCTDDSSLDAEFLKFTKGLQNKFVLVDLLSVVALSNLSLKG